MHKRRNNRILGLKDSKNQWIFDAQVITDHIYQHFLCVYSTDHSFSSLNKPLYHVPHHVLSEADQATLSKSVIEVEITDAI